jgi:hypothetical protein
MNLNQLKKPSLFIDEPKNDLLQVIDKLESLHIACEVYEAELARVNAILTPLTPLIPIIERLGLADMTNAEIEKLVKASEQIRGYIP